MTVKRKTDPSAPLTDPWFEDSQPVIDVPAQPPRTEQRQRRERTQMPKL